MFLLEISTEGDNDIVVDSKVGDSGLLVDIKVDNVTVVVVVPNINFSCRNCQIFKYDETHYNCFVVHKCFAETK